MIDFQKFLASEEEATTTTNIAQDQHFIHFQVAMERWCLRMYGYPGPTCCWERGVALKSLKGGWDLVASTTACV